MPANVLAQNLVPNPGFELFYECPTGLRQLKKTKKWYAGNTGTPEYFRTDCDFLNGKPNTGRGYAGLILFGGYADAIEYIGVELKDSLIKNANYCVSFHIRAADSYMYIDQIGALLTTKKTYLEMWAPIYEKPQIVSNYSEPIVPELGWVKVEEEIKSEGSERFLLIGNFIEPDRHVKSINEYYERPGSGWNSYYLLDDVSVVQLEGNQTCEDLARIENTVSDAPSRDTVRLENVFYFDSDEFELTELEFKRLVQWKIGLRKYQVISATVSSNTDADAPGGYNEILSKKRSDYILSILGSVLDGEIIISNNGEDKPVASNLDETGKSQNRNTKIQIIGFDRQKR